MMEDRLNGFALLYIHRDKGISKAKIFTKI